MTKRRYHPIAWGAACALLAGLASSQGAASAQGSEDLARRQYESGLTFVQNGRYSEALKDFQAVVDSFAKSAVADDALLQIAIYHLDVAADHEGAQAATDRLLKEYPASDSAPMGYVLTGRLTVAKSQAPADVDAALASFDRVPRLFPASPAVAAARYFSGETMRIAGRTDDAQQQFRRVTLEYPQSTWAARANLAAAANLVATERATQAFARLQRIRQQFPRTPEAALALDYNSILYRLYLRKPAPYAFSGRFIGAERARFRDVFGLIVDPGGRVLLGHREGIAVFDQNGTITRNMAAVEPSAFFVEGHDRIVVARRTMLVPDGGAPVTIQAPVPGRVPREVEEIPAAITLSGGDRLLVDRKAKTVIRVSQAGKFVSNFATVDAEKIARNSFDEVAILDRASKGVVIVNRDGRNLAKIPAKGPTYQFEDAADLAYDALGHLYVLDSRRAAIHVFNPRQRLIASITVPGKTPGALQRPRAMALDPSGRIYVFDESTGRIQVYQ
jgi:TolA-binding protein